MSRTALCAIMTWTIASAALAGVTFEVSCEVPGRGGFSAPNALRDAEGKTLGIVAAEGDIGVVCLGLDGTRIWEYAMEPRVSAAPAVADVDGDGAEDVIAADGKGNLAVLDAHGAPIWRARVPAAVAADSCPAAVDLDADGAMEVLVGDIAGYLSCFDHAGNLRWQFQGDGSQMGPILAADVYDQPGLEVFVTSHDQHIYALAANGEWLWDLYTPDDLFPNSTPILADADGDGAPELYVGGGLHHFYRIDLASREIILAENVYLHVNGAIQASDLDSDGKDDVVFGNKNGGVWCYSGGAFKWTRAFTHSSFYAAPLVLNLDEDADQEVLFFSARGDLQVLDADGTSLGEHGIKAGTLATPFAGDLDADGALEVIVTSSGRGGQGLLQVLEFAVPYAPTPNDRIAFAGNRTHSGQALDARSTAALPTPEASAATMSTRAAPLDEPRLLSGTNRLRYDVSNPDGDRLVLLVALTSPEGATHRFARHVHAAEARVSTEFDVVEPGAYELDTRLVDVPTLRSAPIATHALTFTAYESDAAYLNASVFPRIEQAIGAWRPGNPASAEHAEHELLAMKGALAALADADPGSQPPHLAALRADAERLCALAVAGIALAPKTSFCAWHASPWAYFHPIHTVPSAEDATERIDAALCMGEYESLAVNLTNFSGQSLDLRVELAPPEGESATLGPEHVAFRRAVTVPTIRREHVADALVALDDGGLLTIPPMETRQLWITACAEGLTPGAYEGRLHLQTLEPDPVTVDLPMHILVHDLALPRPRPLRLCTWAYDNSTLGTDQPHVLQDLVAHGETVFFGQPPAAACNAQGELTGPLDFAAHDESVKRLSPHGILLFLSPQNALTGQPFLSEPWRKAFITYLRDWAAHTKTLGLDYGNWALYPYDEPSTPFAKTTLNLVEVAKLVRQADPAILVYTDPTSGTTMETVDMFTGLIDIWCPSSELLERLGPELIPAAKKVGKEVWFYDAAGRAKTLSCLGIYRWRFWYAWNLGLTGVGWWCHSHDVDAAWQGPNPANDFFGSVYAGPGGQVVPSKRWEAAREGVEDYEYLWLLREAVADAERRGGQSPELEQAKRILAEWPPKMEAILAQAGRRLPLTPDSVPLYNDIDRQLHEARQAIIKALIGLNRS